MVKKFDEELIKKGILKFDSELHSFNKKKSHATVIPPFPGLKLLGIDKKNVELTVTIELKNKK